MDRPCAAFEPLLMLYAAGDELDPAEHAEVVDHILHCTECNEALEREKQFLSVLAANRSNPDATMLASCRAGLVDALDRTEDGGWLKRALRLAPVGWISPRPAWSAGLLLLLGFSVGMFGPRLFTKDSNSAKGGAGATGTSTLSPIEPVETATKDPNLDKRSAHGGSRGH